MSPLPGSAMLWPRGHRQPQPHGSLSVWTEHRGSEITRGLEDSGEPTATGQAVWRRKPGSGNVGSRSRASARGTRRSQRSFGRSVGWPCGVRTETGSYRAGAGGRSGIMGHWLRLQRPGAELQGQDVPAAGRGRCTGHAAPGKRGKGLSLVLCFSNSEGMEEVLRATATAATEPDSQFTHHPAAGELHGEWEPRNMVRGGLRAPDLSPIPPWCGTTTPAAARVPEPCRPPGTGYLLCARDSDGTACT